MALRYDEIADLIKIIDSSACDELVLETGDIKLVVRRRSAGGSSETVSMPRSPEQAAAPQATPAKPQAEPTGISAAQAVASGQIEIRAPMVGSFYLKPSPDAPPFVQIGDVVQVGQAIGVIEVMKLFTTIYAEQAGRVVRINVENGVLVEHGQLLYLLDSV